MLHTHIAFLRKFYISGMLSGVFLVILSILAIFPVANSFSGAEAAAVISETTLAMTTSDIDLPITVTDIAGTFATSDPASFTVTTNNYSGYTLNVHAKTDDEDYSKLLNGEYVLNSISSVASDETGFNAGNWGFKPSKVNSAANNDYLPAPTYEGTTLDTTAVANNNANSYTIELGAKVSYAQVAGKYSNTFVLVALANPIAYSISYSANTEDASVQGIPGTQSDEITTTAVELSSNVPTRTNYTFTNWCLGTVTNIVGADSCDGTVYAPGDTYDINQTSANIVTLKAMWTTTMPKAVLGANGNLNFVYDDIAYDTGKTYTDNLGETIVSAVYEVPAAVSGSRDKPGWTNNNTITSANFTPNFYSFKPTSTAYWFYYDSYIASVTNAENLDTSSVTNMEGMFYYAGINASEWSIDAASWDVSDVESMKYMFALAGKNATDWCIDGLEYWNTESVNNLYEMFMEAGQKADTFAVDLSSWDVSNVTDTRYMFQAAGRYAKDFSVKLNGWSPSSLTNPGHMFDHAASNVTDSIVLQLDNWVFPNNSNAEYMFIGFGANSAAAIDLDLSTWDVSGITNMYDMFSNFADAAPDTKLNLSGWTINANNVGGMLNYAARSANYFVLDASNWTITTSSPIYNYIFYFAASSAKYFELDCSGWYLPNLTNLNSFFVRMHENGESLKLDMSNLNAPNLVEANETFSNLTRKAGGSLTIDITNWHTPKLESTKSMFAYSAENANSISLIGIDTFDVSTVKNMERMFQGTLMRDSTAVFNIDLSSWNVSSVENMDMMFSTAGEHATSWSVGDLSSWNVSSVKNMQMMFSNAGELATSWSVGDISSWTTTSVTNMSSMFYSAGKNATYTLDLSGWDVQNVTSHNGFNTNVDTKITPPVWVQ